MVARDLFPLVMSGSLTDSFFYFQLTRNNDVLLDTQAFKTLA